MGYIVQGAGSAAVKKMAVWEEKHNDIAELYLLNDALIDTIEQATDMEAQMALVGGLVETLGESADVLSEEYISLCSGSAANQKTAKTRVEGALRKVYVAMQGFHAKAKDSRNAAVAIVKKIKRQLEQVIANFVEFVTLSLDRMMQKQDIEELNAHHASIALMLHTAKSIDKA